MQRTPRVTFDEGATDYLFGEEYEGEPFDLRVVCTEPFSVIAGAVKTAMTRSALTPGTDDYDLDRSSIYLVFGGPKQFNDGVIVHCEGGPGFSEEGLELWRSELELTGLECRLELAPVHERDWSATA